MRSIEEPRNNNDDNTYGVFDRHSRHRSLCKTVHLRLSAGEYASPFCHAPRRIDTCSS